AACLYLRTCTYAADSTCVSRCPTPLPPPPPLSPYTTLFRSTVSRQEDCSSRDPRAQPPRRPRRIDLVGAAPTQHTVSKGPKWLRSEEHTSELPVTFRSRMPSSA